MKWCSKFICTVLLVLAVILVYYACCDLWRTLEVALDGEIHVSNADTIVNVVITYLLTRRMIKECLELIYSN